MRSLPAVQWKTSGRCVAVAQGREQGAEARGAAARIVAVVVGQEPHHQERVGAAVGDRAADLVADARLDMGADDAAGEALDQVRRLGRLADAAQVDDGPDAELAERGAVGVGQAAEMGGAEHRVAAHRGAVGGAVAAEVAEVGAAFERHDEGKFGRKSGMPCRKI